MQIQSVKGFASSVYRDFIEKSWQGKAVQILCAVYGDVFHPIKTDPPSLNGRVATKPEEPVKQELSSITSSQENQSVPDLPGDILELHIFPNLNAEELAKIAPVCRLWKVLVSSEPLSYVIPFTSWLKNIEADALEKKGVELKKYGLDSTGASRINRLELTKALKPLSRRVEKNMGITNMVLPKGLTLKIALQIAKDYSVPIHVIWQRILTDFGESAVEQTHLRFFTNSFLTGTRNHTPEQHAIDVNIIGKECGISIQMHNVRDFIWFLVCTYLESPENDRTQLYSSFTYTRLIDRVNNWSLYGGFAPSGLRAFRIDFDSGLIGVGASGSSLDIGS